MIVGTYVEPTNIVSPNNQDVRFLIRQNTSAHIYTEEDITLTAELSENTDRHYSSIRITAITHIYSAIHARKFMAVGLYTNSNMSRLRICHDYV